MAGKFLKRIMNLFEKRRNLENELHKCHETILEYKESQSCSSKNDAYLDKGRNYVEQAVIIELIYLAAKKFKFGQTDTGIGYVASS